MDLESVSTSALAYVGDAVFSLYVRVYLTKKYDYKSGELTFKANKIVSAKNQSKLLFELEKDLTEEEAAVIKRCRNSHSFGFAKNASVTEYRRATGLEGLLGYLYLKNDPRLEEILLKCVEISEEQK